MPAGSPEEGGGAGHRPGKEGIPPLPHQPQQLPRCMARREGTAYACLFSPWSYPTLVGRLACSRHCSEHLRDLC